MCKLVCLENIEENLLVSNGLILEVGKTRTSKTFGRYMRVSLVTGRGWGGSVVRGNFLRNKVSGTQDAYKVLPGNGKQNLQLGCNRGVERGGGGWRRRVVLRRRARVVLRKNGIRGNA